MAGACSLPASAGSAAEGDVGPAHPDFQQRMLPLLRVIATADKHRLSDATKALAQQLTLSEAARADLLPDPLVDSPPAAARLFH